MSTPAPKPGKGNKAGALLMIGGAAAFFLGAVGQWFAVSAFGIVSFIIGLVVFVVTRFRE